MKSVEPRLLAFALISGVGLNWDGLDILYDGGWRRPILVSGLDWRYSFFAEAETPGWSYKAYYWGSSAFPGNLAIAPPMPLAFASFGDPHSDPRMNLPDLLGLAPKGMTPPVRAAAERLGFRDDPMAGQGVLGIEIGRQLGRLLLVLRAGAATDRALAASAPGAPADALTALLLAIGYARRSADGRWALTAPVLSAADRPMLEAARALNRRILRDWFRTHYAGLRARLAGLSALRQGVPFEALFTQIWHELFGLTTRELAAIGMTADPYAPGNPSPGSLGMAWQPDLIRRVWR